MEPRVEPSVFDEERAGFRGEASQSTFQPGSTGDEEVAT